MDSIALGYRSLLLRYLGPHRLRVVGLAVLLLGSIGLQVLNPQFLRLFIDGAQTGVALRALMGTALVFLGVGLARRALALAASYLSTDLGWRATNALRMDLMNHCLSLDMPFHKAHTPGQLIERIDGDVTAMTTFFARFVVQVLGSVLLLLGVLVALYLEDWRLGLGLTLLVSLALAVLARLRALAVAEFTQEREESAQLYGFIEERLSGIEDIRANGGGGYTMRRLYERMRTYTDASTTAWLKRIRVWMTSMALIDGSLVTAYALGAYLYLSGRITLGTVYLLTFYVGMLADPIERLSQQLQEFQQAGAGAGRVAALLGTPRQIVDGPQAYLDDGPLDVTFRGVSFAYEDSDQAVLHDLSFHLRSGASLGLLGRTGSGKTTLTRLLFRFYDPTAGEILLDGTEIRTLGLEALRRRVGLVTQGVQLFQATVRENLTLFDATIPDERILSILDDMGIVEWCARLPQGLDTPLAAGSGGLSAGEAQLLSLARVFLRDPGLVILDEPSAQLDPATERLIARAMERLLQDRTAIVIAHRLATVQRVEEIMIVDEGRIVEHGPRAELVADPDSRFAGLLRTGLEEAIA